MSKQEQAAYITPPIGNASGMKRIANIVVSTAGITQGMSGLFGGGWGDGEYVTMTADGCKVYYRFDANNAGSVDAFATGAGLSVAYPLPDGASMSFIPVAGRELGTGIATMCRYDFLIAKVASGGVQTGWIRLYRNVGPGKDAESLKGP